MVHRLFGKQHIPRHARLARAAKARSDGTDCRILFLVVGLLSSLQTPAGYSKVIVERVREAADEGRLVEHPSGEGHLLARQRAREAGLNGLIRSTDFNWGERLWIKGFE